MAGVDGSPAGEFVGGVGEPVEGVGEPVEGVGEPVEGVGEPVEDGALVEGAGEPAEDGGALAATLGSAVVNAKKIATTSVATTATALVIIGLSWAACTTVLIAGTWTAREADAMTAS